GCGCFGGAGFIPVSGVRPGRGVAPTPVGRGKPGPTVEAGPSLAAEAGSFFVGPGLSRPAVCQALTTACGTPQPLAQRRPTAFVGGALAAMLFRTGRAVAAAPTRSRLKPLLQVPCGGGRSEEH